MKAYVSEKQDQREHIVLNDSGVALLAPLLTPHRFSNGMPCAMETTAHIIAFQRQRDSGYSRNGSLSQALNAYKSRKAK